MAGDPFLSDPSRKRKRSKTSSTTTKARKSGHGKKTAELNYGGRDEEISGSETDEDPDNVSLSSKEPGSEDEDEQVSSDEEFKHESAADKRRRLAKQYLENLQQVDLEANDEFSAKDLDDDIIGRRLQRDVAETKGHIFKFFGDMVSSQIEDIQPKTTRIGSKHLTGLSISYPYIYTVSKDIELIKWQIDHKLARVKHTKGGGQYMNLHDNPSYNHHYDAINCVAASHDGKYVVTGGNDGRLIIWASENLTCLKVFETRSCINAICFRKNSDQLFAACSDLKIRTYSINQFSQVEILYGHQDNITDISALIRETCVSVGSRDRTALFWKIADESRLTFRGGDSGKLKHQQEQFYSEGSIDSVSMIDESHFVTGSDNGNISFWSLAKKKPLYTQRIAHDLQPQLLPTQTTAEASAVASAVIPEPQPYWITALHGVPFSDIFLSGSFSGELKVWRIEKEGIRSFQQIGAIKVKGCINKIDTVEVPDRRKLLVYVLVSKEHKYGRWLGKLPGRNALVSFALNI